MSVFRKKGEPLKTYMVTLRGYDSGQSKVYVEDAVDGVTALIQARLRHAGSAYPWDLDLTRYSVKEV